MVVGLLACTGDPGPNGGDGHTALATTSAEPPGANCANGGVVVQVGVDTNDNGTLDASEVTSTSYVCDGDPGGGGHSSLVTTAEELAGMHCPFGGVRIETGVDVNDDGTLDPSEVNAAATSYVCNFGPSGALSPSTGVNVEIESVSTTSPVTVRFNMRDDRGFPLDIGAGGQAGVYSINTAMQPRFAMGYFTKSASDIVSPLTMYTKTASTSVPAGTPGQYNPTGTAAGHGTLTEIGRGAGEYQYVFPTTDTANGPRAVAYDAAHLADNHVVWVQVTRQTDLFYTINANTYYAANEPYYFVPSGAGAPTVREIVSPDSCSGCHAKFKTETTTSAAFHGGGRVDPTMCNTCHNPGRTSNPLADSASFIHRIHNGAQVATANLFHGIEATYPRDIRQCDACHGSATQGTQSHTVQNRLACQGCHDYVSFTGAAAQTCGAGGAVVYGMDGKPLPCNHLGGPQTGDNTCATCHGPAGPFPVAKYHVPVAKPDPANAWLPGGTNNNTNASYVAAGGYVPPGADTITYDLKSVDTWLDGAIKRPQITFKLKRNGTDVVFQTYSAGVVTELMPNFVGSPSVYFAFAVPQDGNASPTDFNASASGYIKKIWDGSATGTGAGTIAGPDATGYYTIKLTGVQIPATAKMLTGGVGYTYSLSSTPPLVQTNVMGFPWTPNVPADGKAQGGLSVPAPNVWKTATGFTGRRAIVDNAKCKACHGTLGVEPNFHAGQRNDGPTCSFCHNPNRTSSGWSAGSKYFLHAIHAGRKRTTPFTWHAAAVGAGFGEVEFPGTLNTCTTCHVPGTYDFSNAANLTALANEPLTTVATGVYNTDPLVNSTYYTISPYVVSDGVTNYGGGFSFNAGTGATTEAAPTTLVLSPITGACSACHDSTPALNHMQAMGGIFYGPRSSVPAGGTQEQCVICHGPGRTAAIGEVHQR
ncbi:MAG: OmcA/MtrC family decaheme c-type cytochrome [Myxococcales bacterium]|nr:OmcA/MtrC family decaheme c-type cytochrome [Myxococcales bacterium]